MSCRRVCRELLSFVRFGELGPRSQPHLDHLAGCSSCRDEVGYDREMVQRLRMALAARIEGMDPSPQAWEQILRRAQAPDPEPAVGWLTRLGIAAARRRTTTAMAGTALALVLALNMEVVSLMPVTADPSLEAVVTEADPASSQRWARPSAIGQPRTVAEADTSQPMAGSQPEVRMTGLVAGLTPPSAAAPGAPEPEPQVRIVFRTADPVGPLADDDLLDIASAVEEEPDEEPQPHPAASPAEPGQPS